MSYDRRINNPGRAEREARKKHHRGMALIQGKWLKLGRKHSSRLIRNSLAVSNVEKRRNDARAGVCP